jgi:cysteinyl-tRNA synthetase
VLSGGFKPYHLRFFLYYTHFKKKLNYTAEGFRKTSDYLDGIRALVSRLIKPAGGDKSSSVHADIEKLVADVEPVFRARVNDNLSVGAAVDGVVQLLESIDRGAGGSPLPEKSAKDLEASLRRIDTVLGTIFT